MTVRFPWRPLAASLPGYINASFHDSQAKGMTGGKMEALMGKGHDGFVLLWWPASRPFQ